MILLVTGAATGQFEGKVVFLTGAGSGIARASARMFAQEGAKVVIVEFKPELGQAAETAIKEAGDDAIFIETDVTRDDNVRDAVSGAVGHYGRLDVLVNCAGGSVPQDDVVTDVPLAVWDHTISRPEGDVPLLPSRDSGNHQVRRRSGGEYDFLGGIGRDPMAQRLLHGEGGSSRSPRSSPANSQKRTYA